MTYNIFFEASAIAFLVVLNIYIRLQYNSKPLTNRLYKQLGVIMIVALVLDVTTAVTIDYASYVPIWLNMVLNFMYFIADIMLEYHFVMYCVICVFEKRLAVAEWICRILGTLMVVILLINFFTGWIYSFDETGYVHGPLYMTVHLVPLMTIVASTSILFIGFKKFNTNQKLSVILYTIIITTGPIVQISFPNVLFILFTVALGFTTLTFSMESPDYQALNTTLEELRRTRDSMEKAMHAAQTANKAKSEFLSSVSHEIRTPINAILGYAGTIKRESHDDEITRYSGNIVTAGKRLLSMVSDILDYSKMDNEDFALQNEKYSTTSFLMDVLSCGMYYSEKVNVEFKSQIDEKIPSALVGDSARLTQIIDNLLSNAAKYTKAGYFELGISWLPETEGKGTLKVYVKDTGIGMKPEDVSKLTAFMRLNKEETSNIPGLGLGLQIATKLLGFMGSTLEVQSEYGKGTTMSFVLEQNVWDVTPVGKLSEISESSDVIDFSAPSAKILAVDDNRVNLELIFHILEKTKAEIDFAVNGREAVEMVKKKQYDIIFMDHMMPVMDGIEALKEIRNNKLSDAPCIVVTANAIAGEREMHLAAGFDDYVTKPITSRRLNDVLHKHIRKDLIEGEAAEEKTEIMSENSGGILNRLGDVLNVTSGMAYCCGDTEFYLQIIQTYLEEDKTADIVKALNEKDHETYRISVHALKSTSRTIGADDMSEEARKLEMAVRENNIKFIEDNTDRVLQMYNDLMKKIKSILDNI